MILKTFLILFFRFYNDKLKTISAIKSLYSLFNYPDRVVAVKLIFGSIEWIKVVASCLSTAQILVVSKTLNKAESADELVP